jgi:DNA ligase-1
MDIVTELRRIGMESSLTQKRKMLTGLLLRASPSESKFIIKLITGELRIGATSGLLEEAIAKANDYPVRSVREAYLRMADLSMITRLAKGGRIGEVRPTMFIPVAFMLAEPAESAGEAMVRFGKEVLAEYKYDGIRAQIHTAGGVTKIFSRRLEEVSSSFPELVEEISSKRLNAILDGEILAFSDDRPIPFGSLQLRLHRKTVSRELIEMVPAHYFIFDLLMFNGDSVMDCSLTERRKILEGLGLGGKLHLAPEFSVSEEGRVEELFRTSRGMGYEGLVLKDPDSQYTPGRRGYRWMKLKKELDTIDAVVVAVEYGHGKRAGLLSDYTFAVRDGNELKTIGKAYSGLTDFEINEMTDYFKKRVIEWRGHLAMVSPDTVVEIAFDSLQRSERHSSGFALRFPRIKRIRWDKSPDSSDTIERVRKIYEMQPSRMHKKT